MEKYTEHLGFWLNRAVRILTKLANKHGLNEDDQEEFDQILAEVEKFEGKMHVVYKKKYNEGAQNTAELTNS